MDTESHFDKYLRPIEIGLKLRVESAWQAHYDYILDTAQWHFDYNLQVHTVHR